MQHTRITMALLLPRIYVYKITFLEVPHYYYGVHLEKKYNEYYMGSPKTNKDFWEFYTPMKEIIKEFLYTDEGWLEALNFEDSLIKPVFNTDPLCLNKNCNGRISLDTCRKGGEIAGQKTHELCVGIHRLSKQERIENGKKAGQKVHELCLGVHSLTKDELSENGKKGGSKGGPRAYELGVGIHGLSDEEKLENSTKGGYKTYENGTGLFNMTLEEISQARKRGVQTQMEKKIGIFNLTKEERIKNGKISGKRGAKTQHAQRWQCTKTGYVSTPCGLSSYQKARGIDTSNRIRIN